MTTVVETIPETLVREGDAALTRFNREQDIAFEVTGIVDPEQALKGRANTSFGSCCAKQPL